MHVHARRHKPFEEAEAHFQSFSNPSGKNFLLVRQNMKRFLVPILLAVGVGWLLNRESALQCDHVVEVEKRRDLF